MADTNQQPDPSSTSLVLEHLSGLIERITFHSEESGFCVLQVKVKGRSDLVTVVGVLPEVRAGEWIEAKGKWIINREYGQQFKAEVLHTIVPTNAQKVTGG
jgi:exodeoxyribonuclease V alpha subunit